MFVRFSSTDVDDPSAESVLHDQPLAYHPRVNIVADLQEGPLEFRGV